jgi:hypothetical protein
MVFIKMRSNLKVFKETAPVGFTSAGLAPEHLCLPQIVN